MMKSIACLASGLLVWCAGVSSAFAQGTRWQTPAGGDASGNYLVVELAAREGSLRGDRLVERVDMRGGYTTGSGTAVVLAGAEPEEQRTIRVHLPYGAALDLAAGQRVHVDASARLRGRGSVFEVLVTRGRDLVLLATSRGAGGVSVARDAEASHQGSRRTFALRATLAGRTAVVDAHDLAYLTPTLLAGGQETVYEGARPPDAFDSRLLTAVRIRPVAAH
jgi:hypothetical protein